MRFKEKFYDKTSGIEKCKRGNCIIFERVAKDFRNKIYDFVEIYN